MEQMPGFAVEDGDLILLAAEGRPSRYRAIFLRDNCHCPKCRHPSGQRLFEIADLPSDTGIAKIDVDGGAVRITFLDGHRSDFTFAWLQDHDLMPAARSARGDRVVHWGSEIGNNPPCGEWSELTSDPRTELAWLDKYHVYGFALLRGVPTKLGAVTEVGDRLGFVRETNYGRLFDVMSVPDPNNLAYSALGLGAHSDNPYRDPTPGVQLLHCLEANAPGGDTILVDGFAGAECLRRENGNAFNVLSSVPATFKFQDKGCELVAHRPMINVDFDGNVVAVHFNNRSLSTLDVPEEWVGPWYEAYRAFASILKRPEGEARFRLNPGDLIVMQNERALHGRTAFDPTVGRRHLQGCYVDKDALESRRRVLRRELGLARDVAA